MTSASRFTLWFILPGDARTRYRALIMRLSAQFGTPAFEPHITLLGGLTGDEEALRRRTRELAAAIGPFEARLLEAKWLDEYYRCLFVEVALSRALLDAHEAARKVFDQRLEGGFYPHLSLVYGDLKAPEKEAIVEEIGGYFDESVRIEELALYDTGGGTPPTWRCVERRRLGESVLR